MRPEVLRDEGALPTDATASDGMAGESGERSVDIVSRDPEGDEDPDSEDSLTFSNGVIEKIVAIAMRDVPGVIGMKGGWLNRVQDAFGATDPRKGVTVEDHAGLPGQVQHPGPRSTAPTRLASSRTSSALVSQKQVTGMTGLEVAGVNLRIEDVLTPEEYEQGKHEEQGVSAADDEAGAKSQADGE